MNMLIFFIIFFEMAVLYFASAVLLNCRVPAPKTGWIAFALMVAGALMVEWTMWTGRADVLFTSYVPLRAHPLFYLGVIFFAVGALTVVGHFFGILVVARREKTYEGSVPLVTYGALTAAVIAAATLLHGAILFISMASAHHLLVDPGMGPAWKVWNTSYFMYMAVLASMIHGFTVPAGTELGMRLRGATQGLFGWLKRAPWGDPGFSSLVFSIVVFGFVGGITGVTFGTEQINIIAHNTLRIPGHFHSTVVSGTAMAFMGITYYVIPLIFRREIAFYPLAKIQPYILAVGMLIFSMAMTFAGTFGVPRRHWDIGFNQAATVAGVLVAGVVLASVRVAGAPRDAEWLEAVSDRVPASYPRLDRPLPEVAGLVDQHGDAFSWERVAGRPALLTFGFGHCATVCPMTVMNARQVQDRFRAEGLEMDLVVITLDPWRDTPARLPALARQFHLGGDGPGEGGEGGAEGGEERAGSYLLSGTVEAVNAALDALQMARERVPETGDIVHPALVYLLDSEGTIVYAASGHAELIGELAHRM